MSAATTSTSTSATEQPAPEALHVPFSWVYGPAKHDPMAEFAALTLNVCNGIQTCLELVHLSGMHRQHEMPAVLGAGDTERLLLLATASAHMLADVTDGRIEWFNERGSAKA